MQRESLAIDRHRNGVDQERHVVVDDLDHRVIGMPAVLFEDRVVDAQPLAARDEFLGGLPVRHRGAVEIGDAAVLQIVRVDEIVVVTQEWLDDAERRFRQPRAREFDDVGEQVGDDFLVLRFHGDLLVGWSHRLLLRLPGIMRRLRDNAMCGCTTGAACAVCGGRGGRGGRGGGAGPGSCESRLRPPSHGERPSSQFGWLEVGMPRVERVHEVGQHRAHYLRDEFAIGDEFRFRT